ncbi:MAG: hypothetical protein ABS69_19480 [Nitrosomonadales bacterium SCN 54-20]|nr:MAG: hypothetical protein ABS69_19480 [Nitrosomonadales bacterium SCN 54-20]
MEIEMQQKILSSFFLLLLTFASELLAQQAYEDEPDMTPVAAPSKARIEINKKYFEVCEAELGPFPQEIIHCPDAVLIPSERTLAGGKVIKLGEDLPESTPRFRNSETGQLKLNADTQLFDDITSCDKPSGIFRDMHNAGCVPGNRIKHLTNQIKGGQTVDWVYICRKNSNFSKQGSHYNELGLIGYNRHTGKTCYFAGQPTQTLKVNGKWKIIEKNDEGAPVETIKTEADVALISGEKIPAPGFSKFDEKMVVHWSVPTFGGCTRCHSNGPFIRYPFNEPVCLVAGSSANCLRSFSSNEACGKYLEQTYARGDRIKYQCRVLKPHRQPGMLYSVVSPFDGDGTLNKFLLAMSEADKKDKYYEDLMQYPWEKPKRLVSPEAKACAQCHALGNGVYATFVNSLFSVHSLKDEKFHPAVGENWRARLFLSNVSETQRSDSAHDKKIKSEGILPIRVSAKSIKEENELREKLSLGHYQTALQKINDCDRQPGNCQWDDHWTMERVKKEPFRYLQEHCSYCHTPEMAKPVLMTEADFKHPDLVDKIIGRLHEPTNPMPPSGQLPGSVLNVLSDYLRKANN